MQEFYRIDKNILASYEEDCSAELIGCLVCWFVGWLLSLISKLHKNSWRNVVYCNRTVLHYLTFFRGAATQRG
jgi:hypothetical protein